MYADTETYNISKIIAKNPNSRLKEIFKAQITLDASDIYEQKRRQYDMVPCIEAAVFHLLDPNFHQADGATQSQLIREFNTHPSDIFKGMTNKHVLSIGGIEAAAFLHLGASSATIYDEDFNPFNIQDHANLEFYPTRFEPNTDISQKFGLVIGSMIFDEGSGLLDRLGDFDIHEYIRQQKRSNWNVEVMRNTIRETFDKGAEEYRRANRISIRDFCEEWDITPRSYWLYIKDKIALPRDDKGEIIFKRPVENVLRGFGFTSWDIESLKEGMLSLDDIKLGKYKEYARGMWELVDNGGMMVVDGGHALASVEGLENCNIEATYTLEYNDEYRLVVMRKEV